MRQKRYIGLIRPYNTMESLYSTIGSMRIFKHGEDIIELHFKCMWRAQG